MFRLSLTVPVLLLVAIPTIAQDLLEPDPSFPPERVVEIQLQSLQRNDVPTSDAGIAQSWAFAHPDNKRIVGPLERFTQMIKGPSYRALLGHREHTIEPVVRTGDAAVFAVKIVTAAGQRVSYQWELSKARSGTFAGSWMTVAVSRPLRAGDAI